MDTEQMYGMRLKCTKKKNIKHKGEGRKRDIYAEIQTHTLTRMSVTPPLLARVSRNTREQLPRSTILLILLARVLPHTTLHALPCPIRSWSRRSSSSTRPRRVPLLIRIVVQRRRSGRKRRLQRYPHALPPSNPTGSILMIPVLDDRLITTTCSNGRRPAGVGHVRA